MATPHAQLYHFESQNRTRSVDDQEIDLFAKRWPDMKGEDPFYSSNFNSRPPDFKLILEQIGVDNYDGGDLLSASRLGIADNKDYKKAISMFARLFYPLKSAKASRPVTARKRALSKQASL